VVVVVNTQGMLIAASIASPWNDGRVVVVVVETRHCNLDFL